MLQINKYFWTPPRSDSDFFNYKGHHLLDLVTICDVDYKLINIDLSAHDRQNDDRVLRKTSCNIKLKLNQLKLPPAVKVLGNGCTILYRLGCTRMSESN